MPVDSKTGASRFQPRLGYTKGPLTERVLGGSLTAEFAASVGESNPCKFFGSSAWGRERHYRLTADGMRCQAQRSTSHVDFSNKPVLAERGSQRRLADAAISISASLSSISPRSLRQRARFVGDGS